MSPIREISMKEWIYEGICTVFFFVAMFMWMFILLVMFG